MTSQEKTEAIAKVISEPKYNAVDQTSRVAALTRIFTKCAQRKGIPSSPKSMTLMAVQLDDDIAEYYGDRLAAKEVSLALDWGTHGEYGEFTGLNADRLFSHIRAYEGSEERAVAFKQTKRERMDSNAKVPLYEIKIRNWNSCAEETLSNWEDYTSGRFRPYYCKDRRNELMIPRRHVLTNCYLWLKSIGVAADDEETRKVERECFDKACKMTVDPAQIPAIAGAIALESFFCTAKNAGFDLGGRVQVEMELTSDKDKDDLKWKSLTY